MPIVNLGTRRLYDALGFDTNATGEILLKVDLATGRSVTLYLGPKPPFGIVSLEGNQYIIPGRINHILQTNINYEAPCFLEIAISKSRQITPQQLDLLKKSDNLTREELLRETRTDLEASENILDCVSGMLALRTHNQLVLKPLIENLFLTGEFEPVSSFIGPTTEILEAINANANTLPHILQLLEGMIDTSEDVLRNGGAILHWLLKAWRERDPISKFMYLFIPLEAILQLTDNSQINSTAELESLESIVKNSNAVDKEHLLQFLVRAKTKFNPTLNSRFEEFARCASIPGWELDVKAFKKYNRMRNLLLHAGNRNVRSHINFEENTRTLEDLVERYVSVALLGTDRVYPSRWRPNR
jgi:hypothetical protein